jgi:hypothetical protein
MALARPAAALLPQASPAAVTTPGVRPQQEQVAHAGLWRVLTWRELNC